ncbi:MAG: glycosyltransferase family 2 protein [Candidatus Korarchaeota archaeon]|nr:glycosyltransferase family 2 protein [Thermoproteota archaeon]
MLNALEVLGLTLALAHFTVPLAYYAYARLKWLKKPWNLSIDENYKPKVTVIIPTYNESKLIEKKLDNVYEQDYSKELMEIVVVDSASMDGTPRLVEEWASRHKDVELKLVVETERRGKAFALNNALRYASGEVIVIADADALWPRDALTKVVKWLSNPLVGAVSCLKKPLGSGATGVEVGYRQYYNVLRVAESKAYSTPIFHGELAAFRRDLLEKVGGFPTDIGADDSHTATKIALMGFRAIVPDDLWVDEMVPKEKYFSWRVRRAQHLIQHFARTLKNVKQTPEEFKKILLAESFLHILNPLLLLASVAMLIVSALAVSLLTLAVLAVGIGLFVVKPYKTWVFLQLSLVMATLRNLKSKEIVWSKQIK